MRRGSTRSSSNGADSRPVRHVLEVGPGTGQASRRLLDLGGRVRRPRAGPGARRIPGGRARHTHRSAGHCARGRRADSGRLRPGRRRIVVSLGGRGGRAREALRGAAAGRVGRALVDALRRARQAGRVHLGHQPAARGPRGQSHPGPSKEGPHMRSTARQGSERCSRLGFESAEHELARWEARVGHRTGFAPSTDLLADRTARRDTQERDPRRRRTHRRGRVRRPRSPNAGHLPLHRPSSRSQTARRPTIRSWPAARCSPFTRRQPARSPARPRSSARSGRC